MNKLKELIKDERKAPKDYHKLLLGLRSKKDKEAIRMIIRDEKKHLKMLKTIKRRLK